MQRCVCTFVVGCIAQHSAYHLCSAVQCTVHCEGSRERRCCVRNCGWLYCTAIPDIFIVQCRVPVRVGAVCVVQCAVQCAVCSVQCRVPVRGGVVCAVPFQFPPDIRSVPLHPCHTAPPRSSYFLEIFLNIPRYVPFQFPPEDLMQHLRFLSTLRVVLCSPQTVLSFHQPPL